MSSIDSLVPFSLPFGGLTIAGLPLDGRIAADLAPTGLVLLVV
jgi:hypothetical protein